MTGIIYGSTTGNTESVARAIAEKISDSELVEAADLTAEHLARFDRILLGSSTWGFGELQDDWIDKVDVLKSADLTGKKIAFFGCGDQKGYTDTFADALGILHQIVVSGSAAVIGQWPVDGYEFSDSAAVVNGKFVGLVIDEDNQSEMTGKRIESWVSSLN